MIPTENENVIAVVLTEEISPVTAVELSLIVQTGVAFHAREKFNVTDVTPAPVVIAPPLSFPETDEHPVPQEGAGPPNVCLPLLSTE